LFIKKINQEGTIIILALYAGQNQLDARRRDSDSKIGTAGQLEGLA
jgi:hypothetical protein